MKRCLLALLALFACGAATVPPPPTPGWDPAQLAVLRHWVAAAPEDALPVLPTTDLDRAMAGSDKPAVDRAATALALRLARMQLLGSTPAAQQQGWHVVDTDARIDLPARLALALAATPTAPNGGLDRFFDSLRPANSDYAALRRAYATEKDPAHRATLALNMERWRWLPASLGRDYVLVNAASFKVGLWRQGQLVGFWSVIVGKAKSPTPSFSATVMGVTFNPWWEVPTKIGPEVAKQMQRHPALARQRGYVISNGRYRQRPGPANSLGQMKLVMPNPFDVYLHDTPEKKLFVKDVRAFSHGCIRVQNALTFATTLLQGTRTPDEVNAIVASGKTTTIALGVPLPVYVTYFTAGTQGDGTVIFLPDVYGRDGSRK